jgi:assimilatory nitrate reductase catalytic subunit
MSKENIKATVWAALLTGVLGRLMVLGSGNFKNFDAVLIGYAFATLFAVFGITRRYALWLQRPPTAMYWRRGWQVFFALFRPRHALGNVVRLSWRLGRNLVLNGMLHLMIENGWLDHEFIARETSGFDQLAEHVAQWTPKRTAEVTGISERAIRQAAAWWGTAKSSFLLHARGIEHHTHGVANCLGAINLVLASGRIGRTGCGYATISGQGNGQGGREHGQKCDQLPGGRDIENDEHRRHVAEVWGINADELPRGGVDVYEVFRKVERGQIKGLLSICFNPLVSLPDRNYVQWMLERLEFFVVIDSFLSETARHADVVLPGSLHEEDEGTVTSAEGRVLKINQAVACPGDARAGWRILQDIARALGRERGFTFQSPKEIFDELRRASAGGVADYSGITYDKIEQQFGVFWPCVSIDHPGTPRLFEEGSWNPIARGRGRFYIPDGKARFHVAPYTPPAEDVDDEFPILMTTGRVVSQYLSGTQTHRIGPLLEQCPVPRSAPPTAWCRRRAPPDASPATTACWLAPSAYRR